MQQAGINIVAKWNADEVDAGIKAMNEKLSSLKIPAIKLSDGGSAVPGINAAKTAIQELRSATKGLKDQYQSLLAQGISPASKEAAAAANIYNAFNGQLKQINATTKGTEDAYSRLSRVTNEATRYALNLGVIYGKDSDEFKNASERANQLTQRLKDLESATGRNFRNVGNYASGYNAISVNMARIVGEMPNFAQSMRIGFMAISNNIQPLAESIQDITRKNKELAASGQPTTSALKQVGAALFSWNTLLLVGVTALTAYGPKLVEFIKGHDYAADALKRLNERKQEANRIDDQVFNSAGQQIGKIQGLVSVIESETASHKTKLNALKDLQKAYPTTLGDMDEHDIKSGKLAKTIKDVLIPAIEAQARVMAIQEKLSNAEGKMLELKYKEIKQTKDNTSALGDLNKEKAASAKMDKENANAFNPGNPFAAFVRDASSDVSKKARQSTIDLTNTKNAIKEVTDEVGYYKNEIKNAAGDIQTATKAGFGGSLTDVGTGASKDKLTEAQKAAKKFAEARAELERNKSVLDVEHNLEIGGLTDAEFARKKLELLTSAFKQFRGDLKQPLDSSFMQDLIKQWSEAKKAVDDIAIGEKEEATADKLAKTIETKLVNPNARLREAVSNTNQELENNSRRLEVGIITPSEAAEKRVSILNKAFDTLTVTLNQPLESPLVKYVIEQLQKANEEANSFNIITGKLNAQLSQIDISEKFRALTPGEAASQRIGVYRKEVTRLIDLLNTNPSSTSRNGITSQIDTINNALEKAVKDGKTKSLIDDFGKSVGQAAEDAVVEIGVGVGNILSGIQNPFEGLISFLGGALQDFGKRMIALGGIMEAAQKAVAALSVTGIPAIIAGVAMVALGQVLKSSAKSSAKKTFAFANGAVVYGPTQALVGEYAGASSNPEIIAPLDKLQSIIGGNGVQQVRVVGQLDGRVIKLIQQRQDRFDER